uniref:Uncharacterized protein n=1 Tax=Mola mola TaxID=94237 RepID=A0A3Q3W6V1_MOLML
SCSASVHDYLDICFPEAQPDKLEHPQSAVPRLSDQTQYLSTWTLSQALLLRGRGSIHSATSPEKAPPPQTSPKDAKTPPSVSSGTPELFSPVTPSLGASAELFSQPCPTPRVEEGGVVIEAITDGVLRWKGETVLQSTFSSKLLNLGQIPWHVNARSLSYLCDFLRQRRPLLVSLNVRPPQDLNRLPYATLRSLRVNTLVHALLRVKHTHLSTIVTVEQPESQQGALVLWGAAVDWLPRFTKNTAVWDFHILLVRECLTAELPELHSTPWSSVQPLDPASRRAKDFLKLQTIQTRSSSTLELDLDTLLSQKYSEVELRVQVTAFHFKESLSSHNSTQPVLDSCTPLDSIVEVLCGDITYTGCGRCSAELDTDANGIYVQCYPCLPHTTVRRYYSGVLTVSGQGSSQVCVQVPPVPLQKILEAPPDKLQRSSAAPGSDVKHIQVAAERIRTVLSLPRKTFILTIRSHFLCDENSVPLRQDFTLLD